MKIKKKYFKHPIQTFIEAGKHFLTQPQRIELLATFLKKNIKYKEPRKWVFIVGCYNSGTTLLLNILSRHPKISFIDEGVFKTKELITPEEYGWVRLWYKVKDKVRLKEKDEGIDLDELKKDWSLFLDKKKNVYLEKSIVNTARTRWLQKNFKNTYFIYIIRNGYAVAEGIRRKANKSEWKIKAGFEDSYPIEMCARQWVESNRIIEEDSKFLKKILKIKYESLCSNPKKVVNEILDFIGIEQMNLWKTDKIKIHEYDSKIKNMNDDSISRLTVEDIKKIEKVAKKELTQNGYCILSNKSDGKN